MALSEKTVQRDVVLLSRLARLIPREMVADAHPLDPDDVEQDPILSEDDLDIADGYHRIAGMISWAQENDVRLDEVVVDVVRVFDLDAIVAVSTHGMEDDDVLDEIYEIAYR